MRVKILGSAAGGGFPQWNCACSNCVRLRQGTLRGRARSQSQVAVSLDGDRWYLLGASPDLRTQIENTPELQPRTGPRHTPLAAIVLTSADVDQVFGLLHLREFQPLRIYATASVHRILTEDNSIFRALQQPASQIVWSQIHPGESLELEPVKGAGSGLRCRALALPGSYPGFVEGERLAKSAAGEAVLGLIIEAAAGGKRLLYAPALPRIEDPWLREFRGCDLLLLDGTFWTEDELIGTRGGGKTAREMGHLPISGSGGSLEQLADLRRPRRIFIHVNNTNPILDEESPEYRQVVAAGWEVAQDGWEFEL